MAFTKTEEEIQKMREGGALLSSALKAAVDAVRPGVKINELDKIGEEVILAGGGKPSFKGYKTRPTDTPFPSTICISINSEVVHGCGDREVVLQEGDVVGLDIGCWYKGLCTDMAVTVPVGEISDDAKKLLQVTKESMYKGVDNAKVGNNVKDISQAIEDHITPHEYGIVRALVGHGVGHEVHEAPHIPNFVSKMYNKIKLVDGMCIAIEPMVGLGGSHEIETADDGWAILMKDGSISGHFEVTIAITNNGTEILTPLPV
jgi:methionyl aminopeptidase